MVKEDEEKLLQFFRALPEEDRFFLRDDVTDPGVIHQWVEKLDYNRVLPILAEVGETIVGDATLHTYRHGWMQHIGEIRCVVAKAYQHKGIGKLLIHELLDHANSRGLHKLQTLFAETQVGAIQAFSKVGFVREAVLKNHVKDFMGKEHDLIIMTNNVSELWRKMEDIIFDKEFSVEA
jgi:RimJ/RimL family protein N-acetyltransferase